VQEYQECQPLGKKSEVENILRERESEILGILFGDGSLSKVGGSVQIRPAPPKTALAQQF